MPTGGRAGDSAAPPDAFDPALLSRFDRARLRVGVATGERPGETPVRGRSQGTGVELETYQTYSPGDDIRHLDWMALGRTDQLLTRRFVAEREIVVHLLVDASASMDAPRADRKLELALRTAVAIAYVALNNNDAVRLAVLQGGAGDVRVDTSRLYRHRGRFLDLRPFVAGVTAAGATPLAAGVRAYLERHRERGLVFLLSDFLAEPAEIENALLALRTRGLEVRVIHVVGHEERGLGGLRGRLRLRDVESGGWREVVLGEADRRRYRESFDARVERIRGWCLRHGIGIVRAETSDDLETILVRRMTEAGMMRYR